MVCLNNLLLLIWGFLSIQTFYRGLIARNLLSIVLLLFVLLTIPLSWWPKILMKLVLGRLLHNISRALWLHLLLTGTLLGIRLSIHPSLTHSQRICVNSSLPISSTSSLLRGSLTLLMRYFTGMPGTGLFLLFGLLSAQTVVAYWLVEDLLE